MRLYLASDRVKIDAPTFEAWNPMTWRPSIEVARDSATYAWPFSKTLLRSTLTRSSAVR